MRTGSFEKGPHFVNTRHFIVTCFFFRIDSSMKCVTQFKLVAFEEPLTFVSFHIRPWCLVRTHQSSKPAVSNS